MEKQEEIILLAEQEKLLGNLEAHSWLYEELCSVCEDLRWVYQEVAYTKKKTRLLRKEINDIAVEFGLEPMPEKRNSYSITGPGD